MFNGTGARDEVNMQLHIEVHGQGEQTLVFIPSLGGTTRYDVQSDTRVKGT